MSRTGIFIPAVTAQPHEVQETLDVLHNRLSGFPAWKVSSGGTPTEKAFFLDPLDSRLYYTPSIKGFKTCAFPFKDIEQIDPSDTCEAAKYVKESGKHFPLSIKMKSSRRLQMLLRSEEERRLLSQTIAFLCRRVQHCTDEDPQKLKCYELWLRADENGDKVLRFSELEAITATLNVGLDSRTLHKEFERFDADKNGTLSYTEFTKFFDYLTTRLELHPIFDAYADSEIEQIEAEGIRKFLKEVQGERVADDAPESIIKFYCTEPSATGLNYREFCDFLLDGTRNGAFNPNHARVYQDMTHPIHHYFIASSHNTYLSGDQLQSKSKVEMYRVALLSGCRCVELDCWDGPGDDPVVYHGYTRTSKIKFRDVLRAINECAFQHSDYPVILSLEVHTTEAQSNIMAQAIKSTFGSHLYTFTDAEKDGHSKWSPEALKKKILVKWKLTADDDDDEKEIDGAEEIIAAKKKAGAKKPQNHGILGRTVMVAAKKTKEWGKDAKPYNIMSIVEGKTNDICEKQAEEFRAMNTRMLSRIYPAGSRINSSNYDPTVAWEHGAQCVALNYQTWDEWMRVNESWFLQNGRCGYILKPEHLRDPDVPRPSATYTLRVTVILGQQLPKPEGAEKGEIIDPYVLLKLRGAAADVKANPEKKTKVIDDNGFSPYWNETFEFTITNLDSAILTLRVVDKDMMADDEIGEASIPLNSLRLGYRSVQLFSTAQPEVLPHAKLFCHFALSSDGPMPPTSDEEGEKPAAVPEAEPAATTTQPSEAAEPDAPPAADSQGKPDDATTTS